jgi:hypothetical protein
MSDKTYHIVMSRWKRNTDWVNLFPYAYLELFCQYDILKQQTVDEDTINTWCKTMIYDKECPENPYNIPENKGNEASVYLKYIIDHYEDGLADYQFFIHDEEHAWHHHGSLYDHFKEAIIKQSHFYNINHFTMQSIYNNIYMTNILEWYSKYIEPYIPLDSLPDLDFTNGHKGAAQFMVNKEVIINLPKSFYEGLYDWIMNSGESSFITGRFLEWTWHIFWDLHPKNTIYNGVNVKYVCH